MAGQTLRRWRSIALLFPIAIVVLIYPAGAADPGANGAYLGSRLMPSQTGTRCPPGIGPMYRADAIVTGTDLRQRPWGFARTFRAVLVKVSGDPRLETDPRVLELAEHADRFVACFRYRDLMAGVPLHDDQGTTDRPHQLTVSFAPAKIDRLLASFGDKPWRGVRPVVVPVLLVHGMKPPPYLLAAETEAAAEQRGAFANAAAEYGLEFRIPGAAELAAWHAEGGHLPDRPPKTSAPRELVVVGTLDWSETPPGWTGKWRTRWHGRDCIWGISGVNYDAAFRNIVAGAESIAAGHGAPE